MHQLIHVVLVYVGVPKPFHKVAKVLLAVVAVLFVVYALAGLVSAVPGPRLWP